MEKLPVAHFPQKREKTLFIPSALGTASISWVLGQVAVDIKSNEITAIPELLTMLDIENSIITLDTMGCQRKIAQQIVKQKADYILAVKGNHSCMQAELAAWWHKSEREGLSDNVYEKHTKISSGHGRIETRTCQQLLVKKNWLDKKYQWHGLKCVI
jgi:predicted transposase YbfD/YdcC